MKRLILIFASIAISAQVWGQTAATSVQPSDSVRFAELAGSVIEASIVRDQIVRREGRTFPVRVQNNIKLDIGPDDGIEQSTTVTSETRRGRRAGQTVTGAFKLGELRLLGAVGGGDAVFTFEDSVLTFIRTFKEGAIKRAFAFSRSPGALTCTASENFAREGGVGGLAMNSAIDGVPVVVISYKEVSSTCRVVKQSETPPASDAATGRIPDSK